ncbi:hypothetical protein CALVIDRAFT_542848 [Calocera viscosa TUFC12733]|uniref:Uncharacterized protein n=1 Tax=Calocera viscosa (strain TUFC12733) TaxID=1330018 RepID=A0A167G8I0_CALVF|nr:hypothetical protein CALVIDRAFT_542848 [Calocera viscosa TUFC12733]
MPRLSVPGVRAHSRLYHSYLPRLLSSIISALPFIALFRPPPHLLLLNSNLQVRLFKACPVLPQLLLIIRSITYIVSAYLIPSILADRRASSALSRVCGLCPLLPQDERQLLQPR